MNEFNEAMKSFDRAIAKIKEVNLSLLKNILASALRGQGLKVLDGNAGNMVVKNGGTYYLVQVSEIKSTAEVTETLKFSDFERQTGHNL